MRIGTKQRDAEKKNRNFTYFCCNVMPLCKFQYGNRVCLIILNPYEIFLRLIFLPRRDIAFGGILVINLRKNIQCSVRLFVLRSFVCKSVRSFFHAMMRHIYSRSVLFILL